LVILLGRNARTVVKRYEELAHDHRIDTAQSFIPDFGNGLHSTGQLERLRRRHAALHEWQLLERWCAEQSRRDRLHARRNLGPEATCSPATVHDVGAGVGGTSQSQRLVHLHDRVCARRTGCALFPAIAQDSALMQTGDGDWKAHIMDTTQPHAEQGGRAQSGVGHLYRGAQEYDHWDFDTNDAGHDLPYGRNNWPNLFAQNIQLWFYETADTLRDADLAMPLHVDKGCLIVTSNLVSSRPLEVDYRTFSVWLCRPRQRLSPASYTARLRRVPCRGLSSPH